MDLLNTFTSALSALFQALFTIVAWLATAALVVAGAVLIGFVLLIWFLGAPTYPEPLAPKSPVKPAMPHKDAQDDATDADEMLDVDDFLPDELPAWETNGVALELPDLTHERYVAMRKKWARVPSELH